MTMEKFLKIITDNNIPMNAHFMSNSSWEGDATEMDMLYYNKEKNTIVFTQEDGSYEYDMSSFWVPLTGLEEYKARRRRYLKSTKSGAKFYVPNAYMDVRYLSFKRAEELYGERLPMCIEGRLNYEMGMVASGNIVSYYMLCKKVADYCRELGEPFKVEGLACSTFISFLLGITKDNPLPPISNGDEYNTGGWYGDNDISFKSYVDQIDVKYDGFEFTVPVGMKSRVCSYLGAEDGEVMSPYIKERENE